MRSIRFLARQRRRLPFTLAALSFLILFVLSSGAIAQETPTPPDLSSSELAAIESGEVQINFDQESSINRGVVVGIVQQPINDVIPLIARCWEYADWRESVSASSLEDRVDSENIVCGGTAKVPFPARDRHGHFEVYNRTEHIDGTPRFVSSFDYISDSGNLDDMHGYWILQRHGADGEHTLLKHVLNVDIGGWLPDFLVRWANRRTLPGTILGLREVLDDNGLSEPFWQDHDYD